MKICGSTADIRCAHGNVLIMLSFALNQSSLQFQRFIKRAVHLQFLSYAVIRVVKNNLVPRNKMEADAMTMIELDNLGPW